MDKISVFSKKLGEALEISFGTDGRLVTPEGVPVNGSGIVFAWNNNSGSWQDEGWSNSSGSWGDSGGGSGGCFITSACVESRGLTDDCTELRTLRRYRDILAQEDEDFRKKVLEYYRRAPLIIQEIEKGGESDKIYDQLYNQMVQQCVALLEQDKIEEAKNLYLNYYEYLSCNMAGRTFEEPSEHHGP